MPLSAAQRSMNARAAALAGWSQVDDRTERTAVARAAFMDRFERQVDPDAQLDPRERARRAAAARRAYFTRLALKSSQARPAKKGGEAS